MHIYLLASYLVKVLENQQFKIFVSVFLLITENNIDEKAYRQMIFKKTMDKQSLTLLLPFHNSYKTSFSQYMALFVLYQCLLLDRLHIYEKFYLKGQPPFHLDVARKDLVITT